MSNASDRRSPAVTQNPTNHDPGHPTSYILEVYTQKYWKETSSILVTDFKDTSSKLQGKRNKKKYTSSLCYFDKSSLFKALFVKLMSNLCEFQCKPLVYFKYILSIL